MSYHDKLPWLWLPSQLLLQLPWPFEVELAAVRLYCNYIDSFILEPIHEVYGAIVKKLIYRIRFILYLHFNTFSLKKKTKEKVKNMRAYTMTRNIRVRLTDFLKKISEGKST